VLLSSHQEFYQVGAIDSSLLYVDCRYRSFQPAQLPLFNDLTGAARAIDAWTDVDKLEQLWGNGKISWLGGLSDLFGLHFRFPALAFCTAVMTVILIVIVGHICQRRVQYLAWTEFE
jgi:hypothetical protein